MPNTNTLTLDSSQIYEYLRCPRSWLYKYRLHRRKYGNKKALNKGSFFHALLEAYYRDPTPIHAEYLLGLIRAAKEDRDFREIDDAEPVNAVEYLNERYNLQLDAEKLELDPSDFDLVFSRFALYVANYSENDFVVAKSGRVTGIELGFAKKIGDFFSSWIPATYPKDDCDFIIDGRIDLLIEKMDSLCWVDHKTESQSRDLYSRKVQFRTYDLALHLNPDGSITDEVGYGQINYLGLQVKPTPKTFRRDLFVYTPEQREEWRQYIIRKVFTPIYLAADHENEQNFSSCVTEYGLCDFTDVCDHPDQNDRKRELESNFIQVTPWKPW